MMTSLRKNVLPFAFAIVAIFIGWILWSQFRSSAPEDKPVTVPAPQEELKEEVDSEGETVIPGTYLLYEVNRMIDRGRINWPNDDVEETIIYRQRVGEKEAKIVTKITTNEMWTGSIISYPFGQDILVHRFTRARDAIVKLNGKAEKISESWQIWRSPNGNYEAEEREIDETPVLFFRDRLSGTEKILHFPAGDDGPTRPTVDFITDDGSTIFIVHHRGYEGPASMSVWKLDVVTDTLHELKSVFNLTDLDFSTQSFAHAFSFDRSKVLISRMGVSDTLAEIGSPMPGGPSVVYLIDTQTDRAQRIFEDEFSLFPVALNPNGTQWAHAVSENDSIWIMPTTPGYKRTNSDHFTIGKLVDWLEDGIVIVRPGNELVYIDQTTHEVSVLARSIGSYEDRDYQTVEYIGSVEIQ